MKTIHISRATSALMEHWRTPGASWSPGSFTNHPDGSVSFAITPDVEAKLATLRFPNESYDDLLFRIMSKAKGHIQ